MARYPTGSRAARRARNRIYTVLALLIMGAVFVYIYGYFDKNETEPVNNSPLLNANPDFNVPVANETIVTEPPAQLEPAPVHVNEPSFAQIPSGPSVDPNPEADVLIKEATTLLGESPGKIIEARDKLNMALRMPMSVEQRSFVKGQLSELADKWLINRTVYPDDPLCETYRVKPGEILSVIGERYKVPFEIIMKVNNINDARSLQAGQNIKVINGPFHAKVYRSTFTMDVYLQNTFVRSFRVGLGLPDKETPVGLWRVDPKGKMEKPIWYDEYENRTYYPEDPDYPLGSRWIGLQGIEGEAKDRQGFAIHGTKDPEQIGTQGSRGCIRMYNGDVILVYNLLFPGDSLVEVTD